MNIALELRKATKAISMIPMPFGNKILAQSCLADARQWLARRLHR